MSVKKIQNDLTIELRSLLLTCIFLILTYVLIKQFYHPAQLPYSQLKALIFLPDSSLPIQPKPVQMFTWTCFLFLIPIYVFVSLKLLNKIKFSHQYFILISIAVLYAFFSSDFKKLTSPVLSLYPHDVFHYIKLLFFLGLIIFLCFLIVKYKRNIPPVAMIGLTLLAVLIPSLSFRLESLSNASDTSMSWWTGFDAVFYPVSQVINGKTLLVNLPSQYGLYPEILNLLFKIIPLNVFNFSLIMEIAEVGALLSLSIFIMRIMKNKLFALTSILSLCWVMGGTWLSNLNHFEPYHQYAPIRILFPALSILFFFNLLKNYSTKNIIGFSIFGALAVIWNMDSGIPVIGAFWVYGFFRILFNGNLTRTKRILQLSVSLITVIFCWTVFFIYLYLKSGHGLIDWYNLTKYQKTFAITGFGMILTPLNFHLWMIFYSIYILGFIAAFHQWMNKKTSNTLDLIFYMSILGFGLFTYYQGRSHEYNLVAVSWLPLLIAFILSDRTLKFSNVLAFPFIFISVVLSLSYCITLPNLFDYGKKHISTMLNHNIDPIIAENISFIKSHTMHSTNAVILARNQGIYYAQTKLASPINAPGLAQMILQSDADNFIYELSTHPVQKLYIQSDENNHIPLLYQGIVKQYHLQEKSHSPGNLFYLTGKN